MPLYVPLPVYVDPEIRLASWRVYALPNGDHHFVGWNLDGEGRVSSKIVSFDPTTRIGITRSGRAYELVGDPGNDSDALYTWGAWKRFNNSESCTDVTDQYFKTTTNKD